MPDRSRLAFKRAASLWVASLYQLHQPSVVVHHVVFHLLGGDFGEQLSGAFNLGFRSSGGPFEDMDPFVSAMK